MARAQIAALLLSTALVLPGSSGQAQEAPDLVIRNGLDDAPVTIRIAPATGDDPGTSIRVLSLMDAFESEVTLRVRIDPALIPSERVIEMVESIGMVDEAGITILRGYDIDVQHDIVLGFSGGTAEITNINESDAGIIITALFKDADGNIVQPPASALGLYTTGGDQLCFTEETVTSLATNAPAPVTPFNATKVPNTLPMVFTVLMDRSGSMSEELENVKRAARSFIDDLPDGAMCLVGMFADEGGNYDPANGLGAGTCQSSNFPLTGVQAGGGTDLFRPLGELYNVLQRPRFTGYQKAVIIITDGEVNANLDQADEVLAAKADTVTFVYFLGGHEERFLKNLADNYLTHEGSVSEALPEYFSVVSEAYSSQTVLRQTSCPAPAEPQP